MEWASLEGDRYISKSYFCFAYNENKLIFRTSGVIRGSSSIVSSVEVLFPCWEILFPQWKVFILMADNHSFRKQADTRISNVCPLGYNKSISLKKTAEKCEVSLISR